jgi:hypothetical protein
MYYSGFKPHVITQPMLERYFEAERLARSDIYVVSDDDIIPCTEWAINEAAKLMTPEIGMLGLSYKMGLREGENSWYGDEISPGVLDADHIGGILLIRKGILEDIGESCDYPNGYGDDKVIASIVRKKGYKVGITTRYWFHHLGEGFSTVWK